MTMSEYTVTMSFSAARSRILVTAGADELMRAVLPPPRQVRNDRAALALLEALDLWLDRCPALLCLRPKRTQFFAQLKKLPKAKTHSFLP
jgi:hypothetical protein